MLLVFYRSVHEVASRDYSPAQISAWAPERPDRAAWARRLEGGGVFVYERNNQILGFARLAFTGCVDLLFVLPEAQRQGVARALFDRVVSYAVIRGICQLHSEVSVTARPFLRAWDFVS
jgi:putative acetyltransferase